MECHYFQIRVHINPDKAMKMPYNKRIIPYPSHHLPKQIETYPHGHVMIKTLHLTSTKEIALIIRALVTAFGGTEAVESAISSYVFPIPLIYDMFRMPNLNFKISILNDKCLFLCIQM